MQVRIVWISIGACANTLKVSESVIINPDAHSVRGLADVSYGVMAARKEWIEPENVLNSLWDLNYGKN